VFVIRGRGLVATGKIEEGALRVGDEVQIGDRGGVRVDGIEMFRKLLDHAQAGDNVGLLFKDLTRDDVRPGAVVTGAGEAAMPPRPPMPPPPPPPATPGSGRDPRFADAEAQRAQFLSMREAGLMNNDEIDQGLRALMFETGGRHWVLNAGSDQWYSSDGGDWKHDTPPA
jgi:elongation factor Tu